MSTKCEHCTFVDDFGDVRGKSWSDKDGTYTTYICCDKDNNTYYLETETNFGPLAGEENMMCETANIEHCPKCGSELGEV